MKYGDFGATSAIIECELLDCRVKIEGGEEFGRVLSASLEIEAACLYGTAVSGEAFYGSAADPTVRKKR